MTDVEESNMSLIGLVFVFVIMIKYECYFVNKSILDIIKKATLA